MITWKKKANNFQVAKFSLRVLVSFSLIFWQVQPGVACESVALCAAAIHNFQNPICTAAFCRSLPRAFSPFCVRHICDLDAINIHLLQIIRFATVKLKVMFLDFFYLDISNI